MLTMWSYPPAPDHSRYDVAVNGRTVNDATRVAAMEEKPYVGQTIFLDMASRMTAWWNAAASYDGVAVIHNDGIHTNVWAICASSARR